MITIDSGSLKAKTVLPGVSMEVSYYVVNGLGPGNRTFHEETETNTITVAELAVGEWSVAVEAWNDDVPAVCIGYGENLSIMVEVGKTTPADVSVYPLVGDGKLSVYMYWPAGEILNPLIEYSIVDAYNNPATTFDNIPVSLSFDIDGVSGVAESVDNTIKAGYYLLTLWLKDDPTPLWMQPIAVRIIAVEQPATEVRVYLTADDITGSIDLTVSVDLQDPIDITFDGQQEVLYPDQEITVTADTTVKGTTVSVDSYLWYVGGQVMSMESSLVLTGSELPGGLPEGRYRVDLVVWKGSIIASDCFYFSVESYPDGEPSPYYIKFKADGIEKMFELGLTEVEVHAFGEVIGGMTLLLATPETYPNIGSETENKPNNWIGIVIAGTDPGTYTWGIDFVDLNYTVELCEYFPQSEGTVTITSFGDVGEEITGTFSATVVFEYSPGDPPADLEILLTDGEFKVKRIPDDSWNPFNGGE
jgi:hypothetical protein